MKKPFWKSPLLLSSLFLLAVVSVGWACQVPVFRFALERWEADTYSVEIFPGENGLSAEEQEVMEFLRSVRNDPAIAANVSVELSEEPASGESFARMELYFPRKIRGVPMKPIWSGPATMENARNMVDSPSRREIVKRLLAGESTIWLLVESGDADADKVADETMAAVIEEAPGLLKIPDGVITQDDLASDTPVTGPVDPENILQSDVPLRIGFSTVRISRSNPEEEIFLQMLLNIEDDLGEFSSEPMVFPIFGRGRALEPLIGRGVTRDNAMDYGGYLCGACSCEVKDQNPGMDLLIAANWDAALQGSQIIIDKVLPPLEGTAVLTSLQIDAEPALETEADPESIPTAVQINNETVVEPEEVKSTGNVNLFWLWTLFGGFLLVIVIGTILMKKRAV